MQLLLDAGLSIEDVCFIESVELEMDRACYAANVMDAKQQLDMREAELQCHMESGDALTLMDYYEAVKEETAEKKEGLLKRAWAAIAKFFRTIKEKLFGKVAKDDAEVVVEKEKFNALKKLAELCNNVKGFLRHPVQGFKNLPKWGKLLVTILGILTATKAGSKIKINGKTLNQLIASLKPAIENAENGSNDQADDPTDDGADKEKRKFFGKFGETVKAGLSILRGWATAKKEEIAKKKEARRVKNETKNLLNVGNNPPYQFDQNEENVNGENVGESFDDSDFDFGDEFFEDGDSFDDMLDGILGDSFEESGSDNFFDDDDVDSFLESGDDFDLDGDDIDESILGNL